MNGEDDVEDCEVDCDHMELQGTNVPVSDSSLQRYYIVNTFFRIITVRGKVHLYVRHILDNPQILKQPSMQNLLLLLQLSLLKLL